MLLEAYDMHLEQALSRIQVGGSCNSILPQGSNRLRCTSPAAYLLARNHSWKYYYFVQCVEALINAMLVLIKLKTKQNWSRVLSSYWSLSSCERCRQTIEISVLYWQFRPWTSTSRILRIWWTLHWIRNVMSWLHVICCWILILWPWVSSPPALLFWAWTLSPWRFR
jgi:hypothetical protein